MGQKGYSSARVQLGDGEGVMRSRVLVVLDSEAFEVGLDEAMDLDRGVRLIIRVWVQDSAKLFIKRVYGWHKTERLMTALGVKVGWRQGGTREGEDVIPYLRNECKPNCLEKPLSTMQVLCSDRAELAGLVTELGKASEDIRLATPTETEWNKLAAMVRMDRVTALRRRG